MVKKFFNSSISHIYCTLPDSCYNLLEYSSEIGIDIKEAKKIIETTGINKIRLCKKNQLSSDLCYDAAKKILKVYLKMKLMKLMLSYMFPKLEIILYKLQILFKINLI